MNSFESVTLAFRCPLVYNLAMPKDRKVTLVSVALIAILGIAVYANSISGKFIWDDELLIENNAYVAHWSGIPKIFTSDWGAGAGTKYTFYRPLTTLTFLLNYRLCRLDPRGYHLATVMLHILASLALYWFIQCLSGDRLLSFIASALYVTHPIHTEAVAYISGRVDSLAALFMLLAFAFYIKYLARSRPAAYLLAVLSFALAMLSKESAIIFPALLLLFHFSFRKKVRPAAFMPFLGVAAFYAAARLFLPGSVRLDIPNPGEALGRLPGFFAAIPAYVRLLFFPFGLHMEYGDKIFLFTDRKVILRLALAGSLLAYALSRRKKHALLFFSTLWFFIALLPVSNIYPVAFYMAEHYLYVPSIGFFIILASVFSALFRMRNFKIAGAVLLFVLLGFYSCLTIRQNNYWKEPIAFYEKTLEFAPESWRIHHDLAVAYGKAGKTDKAVAAFKKAILCKSDFAVAHKNLALLYRDIGLRDEAIASLEKAIEIDPGFAPAYANLALIKSGMGNNEGAIALYAKALELDPGNKEAHYNMGDARSALGKRAAAIAAYTNAIAIDPNYADAHANLGAEYMLTGKKEEALASFKRVIEIDPGNANAHNNMAVLYYYSGQTELARRHCDKAVELGSKVHPDFLDLLKPKSYEKGSDPSF